MKKILTILVLLATFTAAYTQQQGSVIPDNRLYSKFQSDDINRMVSLMPQEITYWNWFLDYGFVIKEATPEEARKYPALRFYDKDTKLAADVEVAYDEATFNIMAYDIEILPDKTNTYRIGETGYVLNVYSSKKLVEHYNKFMSHE